MLSRPEAQVCLHARAAVIPVYFCCGSSAYGLAPVAPAGYRNRLVCLVPRGLLLVVFGLVEPAPPGAADARVAAREAAVPVEVRELVLVLFRVAR